MSQDRALDEHLPASRKPDADRPAGKQHEARPTDAQQGVLRLQQQVGNRALQRLLAQRSAEAPFELDPQTAGRIKGARGGGQALDGVVQEQMSERMGHDFSGVRVHASPEADGLNQQLNAKAFTTGQDVFFRQGAYDPGSGQGQELIAHELSHVVQQSTGQVTGSGSGMTVRGANDTFEQQADESSRRALSPESQPCDELQTSALQRQEEEEDVQASSLQRQEEEELQTSALQRQEEEELQTSALQRQEEEELQASTLQRQEEEEDVQASSLQRQEEEELQTSALQRQEEEEDVQTSALHRQDEDVGDAAGGL